MNYQTKINNSQSPLVKKLLSICLEKQTNIALSADVSTKKELISLASELGKHICMLKTHIDMIDDFDWDLVEQLKRLAKEHQFLILEDRKFADIGNTTYSQYSKGIYQINQWANFVTAHGFVGQGLLAGIYEANQERVKIHNQNQQLTTHRGVFLLAQMSCDSPFFNDKYAKAIVKTADEIKPKYPNLISGFIAQNPNFLTDKQLSNYLIATPGVNFEAKKDHLDQQYNSPEKLIAQGSDILIIGRGIYKASNPLQRAKDYQQVAWQAYLDKCN